MNAAIAHLEQGAPRVGQSRLDDLGGEAKIVGDFLVRPIHVQVPPLLKIRGTVEPEAPCKDVVATSLEDLPHLRGIPDIELAFMAF